MIMRIFLKYRIKGKIKKDLRISKANYGLRSKYSIENVILEKRIIYNHSTLTYQYTIHNMIDLEACYNSQFPNTGSIFQEPVGEE